MRPGLTDLRRSTRRPARSIAAGAVALAALLGVAIPARGDDASRLRDEITTNQARVDDARAGLDTAAGAAADALETYTLAVRRLEQAHALEETRRQELVAAQIRLAGERERLGRWARTAYQGGQPGNQIYAMASALTARSTAELGTTMVTLRRVGVGRGRAVDAVEVAAAAVARLDVQAREAAQRAEAATVEASIARRRADDLVAEHRRILVRAESDLARAQDAAAAAAEREQALAAAAWNRSRAGDNRVSGPVGECRGGDVGQYRNGMIPLSALCPLWLAPGHYLRADAANAFDQLSRAYAARFGQPICVTDSYRTFQEQVRLKSAKPGLAATPGTSNHGWGTATDLCGGIQNFGTPQHAWMSANAPLFNWFHPSWARLGGSKPEPWHWEYAG